MKRTNNNPRVAAVLDLLAANGVSSAARARLAAATMSRPRRQLRHVAVETLEPRELFDGAGLGAEFAEYVNVAGAGRREDAGGHASGDPGRHER